MTVLGVTHEYHDQVVDPSLFERFVVVHVEHWDQII